MKAKNPARRGQDGKRGVGGKPPVSQHGKRKPAPAPLQYQFDLWPLLTRDRACIDRQRKANRNSLDKLLRHWRCSIDLRDAAHARLQTKLEENPACVISAGDILCHLRDTHQRFTFSNDLKTLLGMVYKAAGFTLKLNGSRWREVVGIKWLCAEAFALPPALLALSPRQPRRENHEPT